MPDPIFNHWMIGCAKSVPLHLHDQARQLIDRANAHALQELQDAPIENLRAEVEAHAEAHAVLLLRRNAAATLLAAKPH